MSELLLISQDTTFFGIDRGERGALARAASRAQRRRRPRVDPAALPLSDDDHRRRARRRWPSARRSAGTSTCRCSTPRRRPASGCDVPATARRYDKLLDADPRAACPTSRCGRRSSSGSRAKPTQDFEELCDFVRDTAFDHVGVFTYSHEEGTRAYAMADDVPARGKAAAARRADERCSSGSSRARHRARIGDDGARARRRPVGRAPAGPAGPARGAGAGHRSGRLPHRVRPVGYRAGHADRGPNHGRERLRPGRRRQPDYPSCRWSASARACLYIYGCASSKDTRVGPCPLFVFRGVSTRGRARASATSWRAQGRSPSASRADTGSRSSTCRCAASRSAGCCESLSTARIAASRTPEETVGIEDCQRVSQDLSALLDVEEETLGEGRSARSTRSRCRRRGSIGAAARGGLPAVRGTAREDGHDRAGRRPVGVCRPVRRC